MTQPRKRLVNATLAALYLSRTYGLEVSPVTIRSWASRGHLTRYGISRTDAHFDLNEIDRIGRERTGRG